MTTALHTAISQVAENNPAIFIQGHVLTEMVARNFSEALAKYKGYYQQYPDTSGVVSIGLKDCLYKSPTGKSNWNLTLPPSNIPGRFYVSSADSFDVIFQICKFGDPSSVLTTVTISIASVTAVGSISKNSLALSEVTVDFASRDPVRNDPDYLKYLTDIGMSETKLSRMEGLLQGSIAPTLVQNVFRGSSPINLRSIFPVIAFGQNVELEVVKGGLLIIGREDFQLDETARCPCGADTPDITLVPGKPEGQVSTPDTESSTIPIVVNVSKNAATPSQNKLNAAIALYLPRVVLDSMTGGPYPAIAGFIEDNGFLGYSLDYSVPFTKAGLSLDDPRATLVVHLEMYFDGHGDVTVDVPCIGRQTAGRTWASNRGGTSVFELGMTPKLEPNGKITLEAELLQFDLAPFKVDVVTVASFLLSYFGPYGTLAGFVFDRVLAALIADKLPAELRQSAKDALGKQAWTILDLNKIDSKLVHPTLPLGSAVSQATDSVLFGVGALNPGVV